jgi:hypothetical protein
VRVEAMSLVLRPRSPWEGCDLGVRLLQSHLSSVYPNYLAVALPLFVVFYTTVGVASWLPSLLIWISKPWLDRTLLFALSRALFGEATRFRAVWAARREVWVSQLPTTLTLRRLSASRSFTQPVLQLEGLAGVERSVRVRQLAHRHRGTARMMTQVFAAAELALFASMLSLQEWLAPHTGSFNLLEFLQNSSREQALYTTVSYAAAVAFLEPFYVAAGFGMYLNRRVELEAWDVEQELRRAFAS